MIKKSKVFIASALALAMLVSLCSAASYTVKKGDTLWNIAEENDVTVEDIVDTNPEIKDPDLIYVDQVIEIPTGESSDPIVEDVSISGSLSYGGTTVASDIVVEQGADGTVYVPIDVLSELLGYNIIWDAETKTVTIDSGVSAEGNSITITNDNVKITDASFDKYFGGDAAAAVAKLLAEGKCYVNGIQVPATSEGLKEYQVNKVRSLYDTGIGWGYNVHKTTSADNLTFEQARLGFYEAITKVRGHNTVLTLDPETKEVTKIDVASYDVVRVTDIIVYNESTTIVRGDFALETQRVRPDVDKEIFNTAYFDQSIEIGDIAIYWFGPNGWEIKKATPVVGTLSKDENKNFVVNAGKADEYVKVESNVSRYNLIDSSRPSQFYTAYTRMGLTDMEITTWCTPNGFPIGFTTGANSKAVLTRAIATAKAAKEGVTVSETGEGITGMWTTQAAMDEFDAAIAAAEAVLRNNLSSDTDRDMAMYKLSLAYGEAGNKPSGFIGALGNYVVEEPEEVKPEEPKPEDPKADNVVSWNNDNVKITDDSFDTYFGGDAAAAVAKLLAEGKCYVNGIPVPATADETEDYQVNFVSSLYKTETGWGYNVHKTTSANNLTFEDARLGFFETITMVRGHETSLTYDANGNVERIDTQSFDVFRISYFEDHGGQVDKIMRGEFALETNRVRFDVEKITAVAGDDFDDDIQIGDVVVYYYGPNGWVMEKAVAKVGTLSKNENKEFVVNAGKTDEYVKVESNVSRYNLIDGSRPSQFYNAYTALGLQELEVTTWCTPNGYPIGFTLGDRASSKATLQQAIKNAEARKEGVVVSENYGEDVPVGTEWTTQEAMTAFEDAIKAAKAIAYNNAAELYQYTEAMYQLYKAYGEGGNKPSGFVGSLGEGTM